MEAGAGHIEVEPMSETHLEDVLIIERASFPTPWSRASFLSEIRDNRYSRNVVVTKKGRVVAFSCYWIVDQELKINNIAVHPDWRRHGIARALLRWILESGRSEGCTEAALDVRPSNRAALALYLSFGFEEIGRRKAYYQDTREDAILMRVSLSAD